MVGTALVTDYRYLFVDILSNKVVAELPCYGVSLTRQVNKAGNMTATVGMNQAGYSNADVLDSTIPGRTAFYAMRDGHLLWGGPVWTRTYQARGKALSMTGQTWESWPSKFWPTQDLIYVNVEQRNILLDIITNMQSVALQSAGWTLPGTFDVQQSRTVNFFQHEKQSYGDMIDYMLGFDIGFDYMIDPVLDAAGVTQNIVVVGNPTIGAGSGTTGLRFDYPGSITDYWFTENASAGAVKVWGIGSGEGLAMLQSSYTQADLVTLGTYPLLQDVYTNKDVSIQATLDSQTKAYGNSKRVPVTSITIQTDPAQDPIVGSWSLGDQAIVYIEDEGRFPTAPFLGLVRVIGWELQPASSDEKESLKLILVGDDSA